MSIVPAALLIAVFAFARRYPITLEKHRSLLEQLERGTKRPTTAAHMQV
jgi:Na+/melibiose symporter-like transporter